MLAPGLFNIMIQKVIDKIIQSELADIVAYADDTVLITTI